MNMLHALRDCPTVQNIWFNHVPRDIRSIFLRWICGDGLIWIRAIIRSGATTERQIFIVFGLGEIKICMTCQSSYVHKRRKEFKKAMQSSRVINKQNNQSILVKWTPSDRGWIKINTNGSCLKGGSPGVAVLFEMIIASTNEASKSVYVCAAL